jgi:hypothetical protein
VLHAALGSGRDGSARLVLMDKDGKLRASLQTAADGSPSLTLKDKVGNVIWQAPQD